MSEVEQEVKTYRVHYLCDACGEGEMLPMDVTLLSNPALYPHKCSHCGERKDFTCSYPKLITRQIA